MTNLRALTLLVASLLALGEISRWWGDLRFVPLALDEIAVAAAMCAAALAARRIGPVPLAAAWASFCGLAVSLLVATLDHLFHGPPKERAVFYSVILAAMLALGLWAVGRSLALCRQAACEH